MPMTGSPGGGRARKRGRPGRIGSNLYLHSGFAGPGRVPLVSFTNFTFTATATVPLARAKPCTASAPGEHSARSARAEIRERHHASAAWER